MQLAWNGREIPQPDLVSMWAVRTTVSRPVRTLTGFPANVRNVPVSGSRCECRIERRLGALGLSRTTQLRQSSMSCRESHHHTELSFNDADTRPSAAANSARDNPSWHHLWVAVPGCLCTGARREHPRSHLRCGSYTSRYNGALRMRRTQ